MPENVLGINRQKADELKITDAEVVEVASNGHRGRIKAKVTDLIHPDAVFMVHGFGHTLPVESRARGKGVADNDLMIGGTLHLGSGWRGHGSARAFYNGS